MFVKTILPVNKFTTKDILTIAAIATVGGVAGAFIVGPWAKIIEGLFGPFAAAFDNPFFIFWATLAGLFVSRPGAALCTSILLGLIEMLAGGLDGSIVLVFSLMQGIGMELGLAVFRYKGGVCAAMLSTALGGVGASFSLLYIFGFVTLPLKMQILLIITISVTDGLVGGLLAHRIVKSLRRASAIA
jgi:energy-coupling factor transport system substrate-specific component